VGFAKAGRVLPAIIWLMLLPCSWAQDSSGVASAAEETLASAKCGSVVIRHCSAEVAAAVARTGRASAQWQAARWVAASDFDEIVVTGERIQKAPISSVFERNLGSRNSGNDLITTDTGPGVRCTVTRTGRSFCSRGPDETPGSVGLQTDWSDWTF
jgi:hypothetical protein